MIIQAENSCDDQMLHEIGKQLTDQYNLDVTMRYTDDQEKQLFVRTPIGEITALASYDPDNPGITLGFRRSDGTIYYSALLEATGNQQMRLLVWGDEEQEDYTHAHVFTHTCESEKIIPELGNTVFAFTVYITDETRRHSSRLRTEMGPVGEIIRLDGDIVTVLTDDGGRFELCADAFNRPVKVDGFVYSGFATNVEQAERLINDVITILKDTTSEAYHQAKVYHVAAETEPISVRSFSNEWIMTDDDSCQWVKQLSIMGFCLIECGLANPENDTYHVYADTVNLLGYLHNEQAKLESILNGFGYTGIDDVRKQYRAEAMQVMAECVFEHFNIYKAKVLFEGSESQCRKFIREFVCKGWRDFVQIG